MSLNQCLRIKIKGLVIKKNTSLKHANLMFAINVISL